MANGDNGYSPAEDERLRDFCKAGLSFREMARELKRLERMGEIEKMRSRDSLYSRARRLGLKTGNIGFGRARNWPDYRSHIGALSKEERRKVFLPPIWYDESLLKKGAKNV